MITALDDPRAFRRPKDNNLTVPWNALTVHGTLSLWPRLTRIGRGDGNGATAV
jgi:hypothetical protein